eukprot:GHVT01100929.1.p1 GENE.GHVT01100929.1~~GHVT01100929.1.p1  ORF type:complete len:386 (+),score=107.25 GHVT01100929.1:244-1401(+)
MLPPILQSARMAAPHPPGADCALMKAAEDVAAAGGGYGGECEKLPRGEGGCKPRSSTGVSSAAVSAVGSCVGASVSPVCARHVVADWEDHGPSDGVRGLLSRLTTTRAAAARARAPSSAAGAAGEAAAAARSGRGMDESVEPQSGATAGEDGRGLCSPAPPPAPAAEACAGPRLEELTTAELGDALSYLRARARERSAAAKGAAAQAKRFVNAGDAAGANAADAENAFWEECEGETREAIAKAQQLLKARTASAALGKRPGARRTAGRTNAPVGTQCKRNQKCDTQAGGQVSSRLKKENSTTQSQKNKRTSISKRALSRISSWRAKNHHKRLPTSNRELQGQGHTYEHNEQAQGEAAGRHGAHHQEEKQEEEEEGSRTDLIIHHR